MGVGTHERGNGPSPAVHSFATASPRRRSAATIVAKAAHPGKRFLMPLRPPTVMLNGLKPDASGTIWPRASGACPGRARDRSKTSGTTALDDSGQRAMPVEQRTSRMDSETAQSGEWYRDSGLRSDFRHPWLRHRVRGRRTGVALRRGHHAGEATPGDAGSGH